MVYNKYGMSYKKRYNYRKRRYNYNKSTYTKANQALRLAKKAQLQKELKWIENTETWLVDDNGQIDPLIDMAVGDTNNLREGNVVYPTSLKMRMQIILNAATTSAKVRIIIFKWLIDQPSAVTDLLSSTSITSFKSDTNRYKSNILYDKVVVLSNGTSQTKFIQCKINLKGLTAYEDATSLPNKNGYYMLLISDKDAEAEPTVQYVTRMYFKDA